EPGTSVTLQSLPFQIHSSLSRSAVVAGSSLSSSSSSIRSDLISLNLAAETPKSGALWPDDSVSISDKLSFLGDGSTCAGGSTDEGAALAFIGSPSLSAGSVSPGRQTLRCRASWKYAVPWEEPDVSVPRRPCYIGTAVHRQLNQSRR